MKSRTPGYAHFRPIDLFCRTLCAEDTSRLHKGWHVEKGGGLAYHNTKGFRGPNEPDRITR